MSQLELVGENENKQVTHLNCKGGAPWAELPLEKGDLGSGVLDVDAAGNDIAYCYSCGLDYPKEVAELVEAGSDKVDPPLWQFDGIEWRTTA